ncbi:MAG: hypothetical protein HGB26_01955 [Desulfobulbaceae bacterium]|nr:hypothetical protein [Desulfobulbaceae bacterium]
MADLDQIYNLLISSEFTLINDKVILDRFIITANSLYQIDEYAKSCALYDKAIRLEWIPAQIKCMALSGRARALFAQGKNKDAYYCYEQMFKEFYPDKYLSNTEYAANLIEYAYCALSMENRSLACRLYGKVAKLLSGEESISEAIDRQSLTDLAESIKESSDGITSTGTANLTHQNLLQQQKVYRLPKELEDCLISMQARYTRLGSGAATNYESSVTDNQNYLGTYFPRTVIESQNIFLELLQYCGIYKQFHRKESINIFDFGSGTGGAVIGLVLAIVNTFGNAIRINVTALDYNFDALSRQSDLLDLLSNRLKVQIKTKLINQPFPHDRETFQKKYHDLHSKEKNSYDFILSWKCLSEFYNTNYVLAQEVIDSFIRISSGSLSSDGFLIIADVTTKDNGKDYFPIIMNNEISRYESDDKALLSTLIPIPCALWGPRNACSNCFTQRVFEVETSLASKDISKITYRIMTSKANASRLVSFDANSSYRVSIAGRYSACYQGIKQEYSTTDKCGFTNH